MKIKEMVHRKDTPAQKFKSYNDFFEYAKSINTKESIAEIKRSSQIVSSKKPKRNEPCICGSGKKYKKCCINK